jgi:MinD superfamily P-loop ATPase
VLYYGRIDTPPGYKNVWYIQMSVLETTKTQVTAVPHVVDELCHACRKCLARTVCKSKAIVQLDPDEPPFIDASRCYGCHLCITTCPHEAIALDRPFESLS